MRDFRFYKEYTDTKRTVGTGNVVAILPANRCPDGAYEAVGAVFFHVNSPVASTSASPTYLRTRCRRIAESEARTIHAQLFDYLDR